tara:strand:- start:262 stop:567 length:306 start_codon:yes stop_codon:yes gene_type:complete
MDKTVVLSKGLNKGKRYRVTMNFPNLHHHEFGSDVGSTFIDHKDNKIKNSWVARHKKNKNWDNKHAGTYYSRYLLWGPYPSLLKNIKALEKKDGIKIINKL